MSKKLVISSLLCTFLLILPILLQSVKNVTPPLIFKDVIVKNGSGQVIYVSVDDNYKLLGWGGHFKRRSAKKIKNKKKYKFRVWTNDPIAVRWCYESETTKNKKGKPKLTECDWNETPYRKDMKYVKVGKDGIFEAYKHHYLEKPGVLGILPRPIRMYPVANKLQFIEAKERGGAEIIMEKFMKSGKK